jgi:hypothetical protein
MPVKTQLKAGIQKPGHEWRGTGAMDTQVFGINTAGQIGGPFGSHGLVATPDEGDTIPPVLTIQPSSRDDVAAWCIRESCPRILTI